MHPSAREGTISDIDLYWLNYVVYVLAIAMSFGFIWMIVNFILSLVYRAQAGATAREAIVGTLLARPGPRRSDEEADLSPQD